MHAVCSQGQVSKWPETEDKFGEFWGAHLRDTAGRLAAEAGFGTLEKSLLCDGKPSALTVNKHGCTHSSVSPDPAKCI